MNLYRTLLVDDEVEVRKSILKKIAWEEIGFTVVADAENGQDALEKASNLELDVVLTDIKMPFLDGLSLAEKLREKNPSIQIILFSGFDAFEYAQKAIQLNAVEYILKPVDMRELTKILQKVHAKIEKEREEKTNLEHIREQYQKSLPLVKERFFGNLLKGIVREEDAIEQLKEYHKTLGNGRFWTVALTYTEQLGKTSLENNVFSEEKALIPFSVRKLLEECLQEFCTVHFFYSDKLAMIVAFQEEGEILKFLDRIDEVCKESKRLLQLDTSVGIGFCCDRLSKLPISYKEAKTALDYKMILGAGKAIYVGDVEPEQRLEIRFDEKKEQEFIARIKFGTEKEIEETVEKLIDVTGESPVPFQQYQIYLLGMMSAMIKLAQGSSLDLGEIFGKEMNYFHHLAESHSKEQLKQWFCSACKKLNQAIHIERVSNAKQVIQNAKQYIMEHYQEESLSVESLCSYLHISPAYFSTLFKRETGQSYVAYVTDIRLQKAVELLHTTDDKTYMIAEKVGYAEPNYFSYVFKKRFGVSPSKYRGK